MKRLALLLTLLLFFTPLIQAKERKSLAPPTPQEAQLNALYYSLNPLSVAQLLAFYKLYPTTSQGKLAHHKAWQLLVKHHPNPPSSPYELNLPEIDLEGVIRLINQSPSDTKTELEESTIALIEDLAHHLKNRQLKGFGLFSQQEILNLASDEVDLGRALLLFEELSPLAIRQYEAMLDIMALQILATLPKEATAKQKIKAISHFIFYDQGFHFPPHSLYAEDIDLYTFLPTVLDSRQGVCLGVSILYLCLAQRLGVSLEIVTPPGHIFVRFPDENLNIETTARGIHLDDEVYLGINTRHLKMRTLKEVVGLAFINQASVFWHRKDPHKVVSLYEKARLFLPDDPLLKTLLGYNLLFIGESDRAKALLQEIKDIPYDDAVSAEKLPVDYLDGRVDTEGILTVFEHVDEKRSSIEKKQADLHRILRKWPRFRDGWLHLGVTYLQLSRTQEAYESLMAYHNIDATNPTVEYYLAMLALKRFDYPSAAKFLKSCQLITKERDHAPRALKELNREIHKVYPL